MMRLYKVLVLLLFSLMVPLISARAETVDPQYIFVRKDNTCTNCYNWNGYNPDVINMEAINEIFGSIGTKGTDARKLGIGVLFYYNGIPLPNMKASLSRLLDYAKVHDFPVFIALDGYQWWDARPDLWNWFDPGQAGYNPANKNNVEWTCPDPSCAIRKAWRNWGSELVVKPGPNIASRAFIEDNKKQLRELIPIIVTWYNALPENKKWLLGGIDLGTEIDVGANYYVYTNGSGGAKTPIGHAAVTTLGLPGGLTAANKNEVVRRYLHELDEYARTLGIPRHKIFNHVHPDQLQSALTGSGHPGWSMYGAHADRPSTLAGLDAVLNAANSYWSSPEWLTSATNQSGWAAALRTTLAYRNNKFVNVANWEGVRSKPYALAAIREVLNDHVVPTAPPFPTPSSTPKPTPTPVPTTAPSSTATPSPAPVPGDVTGDRLVNSEDYNRIKSLYGNPYSIFDFNLVITNYRR